MTLTPAADDVLVADAFRCPFVRVCVPETVRVVIAGAEFDWAEVIVVRTVRRIVMMRDKWRRVGGVELEGRGGDIVSAELEDGLWSLRWT